MGLGPMIIFEWGPGPRIMIQMTGLPLPTGLDGSPDGYDGSPDGYDGSPDGYNVSPSGGWVTSAVGHSGLTAQDNFPNGASKHIFLVDFRLYE